MAWLLLFLCVLLAVTARQAEGFRVARRVRDLRDERAALEARRAELERRIRAGASRQVLVPKVERTLGLHEPADTEFVLFTVPHSGQGTP